MGGLPGTHKHGERRGKGCGRCKGGAWGNEARAKVMDATKETCNPETIRERVCVTASPIKVLCVCFEFTLPPTFLLCRHVTPTDTSQLIAGFFTIFQTVLLVCVNLDLIYSFM